MKKLINLKNLSIFFIGIGGISMSGLAKICLDQGSFVSGSDVNRNEHVDKLTLMGAKIFNNHNEKNISKDIDLVVFSGAISEDNIELITAKKLNIAVMERSEFVGLLASEYRSVIAISGTHGKTTTSSLIGYIFYQAKLNPTMHIGGDLVNLDSNTIIGGKDYLIIEACEYRESFRFLKPEMLIVTNVECDHLDYYKDYNHIYNAFENIAKNSKYVLHDGNVTFNIDNHESIACWVATNIRFSDYGYDYDVYYCDNFIGHFRLNLLGEYNIKNSLFAIAVAYKYGIDVNTIIKAVLDFKGVKRRNEFIGKLKSVPILCDYAHHPTEIYNSITAVKKIFDNLIIVFQPHTYSRTLTLFQDFVNVFNKFDNVIIYKTYPARESKIDGASGLDIFNAITCKHKYYVEDLVSLKSTTYNIINSSSVDGVLVLGAGDLYDILKKLEIN